MMKKLLLMSLFSCSTLLGAPIEVCLEPGSAKAETPMPEELKAITQDKDKALPFPLYLWCPLNEKLGIVMCHGGSGLPLYKIFLCKKNSELWEYVKEYSKKGRFSAAEAERPAKAVLDKGKLKIYGKTGDVLFEDSL